MAHAGRHFLQLNRRDIPRPLAEGVLRVDGITHVPTVLRDLGLDPDATLAAADLEPRIFDDPVNEIPIASLGRLFASAAAKSGCDHVGLLVGERTRLASLGLVGLLTRHSPDVGTALSNLSAHLHLRDRGAVAPVLVANGIATLGYEIYQAGVEAGNQICDTSMAIGMNIMRTLCGPSWRPMEVMFAHRRPRDLRPFRRAFDAPLRFDAERTALVFASKWLEHRTPGADPALFRRLTRRVWAAEAGLAGDLVAELRRQLRVMLLMGRGSVAEVADRLSMHRRTLNRRLRIRDTTLHRLVEETRFEIARQLLENTRMRLTDIGATLGYADASAFTRAFRRWTGGPPSAWRRQPRVAPVANCQAVPGAATYAGRRSRQREAGRRAS
jgi:AraC-like DNA-binding protein